MGKGRKGKWEEVRKKSIGRIVGSGIDISKQNCVTAKCGLTALLHH